MPRRIHLLGHIIVVKQITQRALQKLNGEDDRPLEGLWLDAEKIIYVNKNLSVRDKRMVVWHEIQHAVTDLRELG